MQTTKLTSDDQAALRNLANHLQSIQNENENRFQEMLNQAYKEKPLISIKERAEAEEVFSKFFEESGIDKKTYKKI